MDSIVEGVNANQQTINKKGLGFKAFIPATFGRLVNEAFSRRAGQEADVKVTAPSDRIRNLKARADPWEQKVITEKFLLASWPKGKDFSAVADSRGRQAFRMAVPEYYAASCLSCHGRPKGDIDVTGYPKEGGNEGDLGGVISISSPGLSAIAYSSLMTMRQHASSLQIIFGREDSRLRPPIAGSTD